MPRPEASRYGFTSVAKDPLDLRDLMYDGSLQRLPQEVDHRGEVPFLLDQGEEGACTGFALAAVVNQLISTHPDWPELADSVSPRMLYEFARRYDEWEGENYEGSSIRGAMKGWMRHGVCTWELWPYLHDEPGELTADAALDAMSRPLGNYFRVRHLHLSQMHAALHEVGVLLASGAVHTGWERVPARGKPRIPFERESIGGHAFAIVGYDREGFWVQNSWGDGWGQGGFAHLSYEDWLENGWDCWVARLGVATAPVTTARTGPGSRATTFDYITDETTVLERVRGHLVSLGNDGQLATAGRLATPEPELDRTLRDSIPAWSGRTGSTRLLLYAHGGLNDEVASARRIASFQPYLDANGIYPLHFMWRTGAGETLRNIVADAFRGRRTRGWTRELAERFRDLIDGAIEIAARPLGRALWSEMKENARLASQSQAGGARLAARKIASLGERLPGLELHLVAHSAGSIFHSHLVPELLRQGLEVRSLTFYAPAVTTELFKSHVLGEIGRGVREFVLMNLTDDAERGDTVGPYGKSLLYLVSESFETRKRVPLLGMTKFADDDSDLFRVLGTGRVDGPTKIWRAGTPRSRTLASASTTHGGFDNDEKTLDSTLRVALRRNSVPQSFARDLPA